MTGSYLSMMADSLDKKIEILKKIEHYNAEQRRILERDGVVDMDAFDATVEAKGDLIDELERLNDGFETLFDQVKEELDGNRECYKAEIAAMQERIRTITSLSGSIQAEEARNKSLAEKYFSNARREMVQGKKSAKAALDYYRSMARSTFTPPQYLDSKH